MAKKTSQSVLKSDMKRQRSPNYPAVSLPNAVARVANLYKMDGRAGAPLEVAIQRLGFKRAHGMSRAVLSALRKFALVQDVKNRVVPTQNAIDIIEFPPGHERRSLALRRAALAPEIYREIVDSHAELGWIPSDDSLKPELIADKEFNPKAVDSFLSGFRESLEFAGILSGNELHLDKPAADQMNGVSTVTEERVGTSAYEDSPVTPSRSAPMAVPAARSDRDSKTLPDTKEDRLHLDEGSVVIWRPVKMSAGSFDDFKSWLDVIVRNAERSIEREMRYDGRRIEVGTQEMLIAWAEGVSWYTPTFKGQAMEDEGGTTETTLENLSRIVPQFGTPLSFTVGPHGSILVTWQSSRYYLATGFAVGYRGEGPRGFADFAASVGFGQAKAILDEIVGVPQDYQGPILRDAPYNDT